MKMKKKSGIKLRSKTFRAFYYWEKILGINPFSLTKKNQLEYSCTSPLYSSFLIVLYCFLLYCELFGISMALWTEEAPVIVITKIVGCGCLFCEIMSAWFVAVIYHNRMKIIVKSFIEAEKTSEKLGIPDNYDEQFKEFGVYLILGNILYLVSLTTSNTLWWHFFMKADLFLRLCFALLSIVPFNAGFILVWCMILVQRKLRRLNETLNRCAKACTEKNEISGFLRHSRWEFNILVDRLNIVSKLHRELRDIIYSVEEYFALFILFSVGNIITTLSSVSYGIARYMVSQPREAYDLVFLGGVIHWMLYPAVSLFVLSTVCGTTSDEANMTGNMIYKLLNGCTHFHDIRGAAKFNALSLDLLQTQVSMSVYGFFKLDHFMFYRTVTKVTSYLIIMLQLYD